MLAHASALGALLAARAGQAADAAARARAAWAWRDTPALGLAHVERCAWIAQAAAAGGDTTTQRHALDAAARWLADALPNVPAPHRDAYLRHPPHRMVMAEAAALGLLPAALAR